MKNNEFSHINEEEFLRGYAEFTVEIRPFIIKKLVEEYRCATSKNEKEMLLILAIEQTFLFHETFAGFFQAIKDRRKRPLLQSLNSNGNIHNLYGSLKGKDAKAILSELNLPIEHLTPDVQRQINEDFVKLAGLFQNSEFYNNMKNRFIPIFYKLKHKMLIYKNNQDEIQFVLEKEKEDKLSNGKPQDNASLQDNIDYLFNMAKTFESVIQNLIAVRLIELQKGE